ASGKSAGPSRCTRDRIRHATTVFRFFFQAEDGIRDGHVTGVQTCALPISIQREMSGKLKFPEHILMVLCVFLLAAADCFAEQSRSEERRVGKECRCWWSA